MARSRCEKAGVCSGESLRPTPRQSGPITFLYPAAAIVAALLLIIMAVV
jgi:hypothetical protein